MNHVYGQDFNVQAYWERKAETPEALATGFVRTIDRLQKIDPIFSLWTCGTKSPKKFETMRDYYAKEVAAGISRDDWGKPEPIWGYQFGAFTREEPHNRIFGVRVWAGSPYPRPFPNSVLLTTNSGFVPDPAVVTYEILKPGLLAIVEAWDPICCASYPFPLLAFGKEGSYFHQTWIRYLCPWLASLVTPPSAPVIGGHLPGGGLLMSATTETFDVANPAHMAAARAIGAAIAPLNDLPWEARARA